MGRICAALILALFSAVLCRAETACVYEYEGEVGLLEPDAAGWRPLKGPAPLKEGVRVRTGPKSSCKLLAGDGTVIDLDENSEAASATLKLEKENRDYAFDLIKGKIMLLFPRLKKKLSRLEVRTPHAVCAVRGTGFSVLVSSDSSDIGLFEGSLDIRAGGKETSLAAGNEAVADAGAEMRVSPVLSRLMLAERRRYLALKRYADRLRRKLEAREGYIGDFLGAQDGKLKERGRKVKERLDQRGKK